MLIARGRYLLVHKQTWYWGALCLAFTLYIVLKMPLRVGFGKQLTISSQTIPALIVMFAISSTSIWSYWFLLAPVVRTFKRQGSLSSVTFQCLFWTANVSSAILFVVYGYSVVVSDVHNGTQHVLDDVFAQLGVIGNILHSIHLVLFVGIYTLMDWIVARFGDDDDDRAMFSSVVMFVDVPILLTMIVITTVLRPALGGYAYFFEAGAISFQLIAGSLAVVGLEYLEKREAEARRAVA